MKKTKILALIGKSGAGKDFVCNWIINNCPNTHKIVSATTRPKREGEHDGVDYFYVDSKDFENFEFLEQVEFRGWLYGTRLQDLSEDKINAGVFNPAGIRSLKGREDIDLFVVYVKASAKTRLERCLNRESNPDVYEICRRFMADEEDFKEVKYNAIFDNHVERDFLNIQNIPAIKEFLELG